jgi:DNA-binding transcriptional ArsR family regulator
VHLFELLADPIRRRIVEILASGEHTAGELRAVICHEFSVSPSAVSNHLRTLRDEEFVDVRSEGPVRVYRLMWNALDRLDLLVEHLLDLWDVRTGYPYRTDPTVLPRLHRGGRKGHRGRSRPEERAEVEIIPAEDFWFG